MEKLERIFQIESSEVLEVFNTNKNYLIEYNKTNLDSEQHEKCCAIYFSSNDIYYPNTPNAFKNQMVNKNKYEWYGTRIEVATKHIFIRDIKKQWYLGGINNEINSVEKILEFLESETKGYSVITIGSSAGGFAAVLFGQLLGAKSIFTFNGQFVVDDLLSSSTELIDPIIFREQYNPEINIYYSLKKFIVSPKSIYYFLSLKSNWDYSQYNTISDLPINFILFKSSKHGIPFIKSSLQKVLNLKQNDLILLTKKAHFPIWFSVQIEGALSTLWNIFNQLIILISKKIKRYQHQATVNKTN